MTNPQAIADALKTHKIPAPSTQGEAPVVETIQTDDEANNEQLKAIIEALPPRYAGVTPDYELLKKVRERGVTLIGGVGTGKTYKMLQVITAYLYEELEPEIGLMGVRKPSPSAIQRIFLSVPDVLRRIKAEFDSPDAPTIIDKMIKTPILFLDDLGAEKASDWVKEQLYIVINDRYNWRRPVMFTSNLTIEEINVHYGDRFTSRLVEMTEIIKLGGGDRRIPTL